MPWSIWACPWGFLLCHRRPSCAIRSETCAAASEKKAGVAEHLEVFGHAGLLVRRAPRHGRVAPQLVIRRLQPKEPSRNKFVAAFARTRVRARSDPHSGECGYEILGVIPGRVLRSVGWVARPTVRFLTFRWVGRPPLRHFGDPGCVSDRIFGYTPVAHATGSPLC